MVTKGSCRRADYALEELRRPKSVPQLHDKSGTDAARVISALARTVLVLRDTTVVPIMARQTTVALLFRANTKPQSQLRMGVQGLYSGRSN